MLALIYWILQLLLVPALSPLFIGVTRKIKARLQNRRGAPIWQPYFDIIKLFKKDEVQSKDASWIFSFAPYIIFTITCLVGASIPLFTTLTHTGFASDFLVVVYLLAFSTFWLALAGLDVGGAFGGLGSSREMTVAALAEGGLVFSLLAVAFVTKTGNLFSIVDASRSLNPLTFIPIFLAFCGFLVVFLAETGRFPFDNPATHLELTMIHEAMILEYSGKKLALIEWAAANKFLIFIALAVNIFFPWGIVLNLSLLQLFLGLVIFLIKTIVICVAVAILESSIAKYRFFRLPDLLLISFVLSVIALGLLI